MTIKTNAARMRYLSMYEGHVSIGGENQDELVIRIPFWHQETAAEEYEYILNL